MHTLQENPQTLQTLDGYLGHMFHVLSNVSLLPHGFLHGLYCLCDLVRTVDILYNMDIALDDKKDISHDSWLSWRFSLVSRSKYCIFGVNMIESHTRCGFRNR